MPVLEDAAQAAGADRGRAPRRARSAPPPRSRSSPPRTSAASATAARSPPPTPPSPSACGRCASTARATRSPTTRSGTTRGSTSSRPRCCGCCCRHLDAWATRAARPQRVRARRGSASSSRCPSPSPGASPAWHLFVVRHRARRRAGGRAARARHRRARLLPHAGPPPAGDGATSAAAPSFPARTSAARRHLAHPDRARDDARAGGEVDRGRALATAGAAMRVWVDLTNSPHVLVLRPVIERLRARGRTSVQVDRARLRADGGAAASATGSTHTCDRPPPRRAPRRQGARPRRRRSAALARWARGRRFDLALGHGSNDVTVAARTLRIPTHDDASTTSGRRSSTRSTAASRAPWWCPRRSRPSACAATAPRGKIRRYPGLKEEYYLSDLEPDAAVLGELGLDRRAADRRGAHPARGLALPPLRATTLFGAILERLRGQQSSCCRARGRAARRARAARAASSCPSARSTRQSLVALADLVVVAPAAR